MWFKNLLYIFILLKCFFWTLNFDLLFGENALSYVSSNIVSITDYKNNISFGKHFAYLLLYSTESWHSVVVLGLVIVVSLYSLAKRSLILTDLLLFLLLVNINFKVFTSTTAGDPLMTNLCFLSIFLRKEFTRTKGVWGELKIMLHNFSFLALVVQVCIVYLYSAMAKWIDEDWVNGNAITLVNKATHYSKYFLINTADTLHLISMVIAYFVLLYQTAFPILVFVPKIKKQFLNLGVLMHLYISFVMGLFFFGLIMALTYVLFYDFKSPADSAD